MRTRRLKGSVCTIAAAYLLAVLAELVPHLPELLANLLRHDSGPPR
jgi:hypothetical protein